MGEFIGFKLFAVFNEGTDTWWSVENGWVEELEDNCLFPTYNRAYEELMILGHTYSTYVYEVEIPQKERNYTYSKVN